MWKKTNKWGWVGSNQSFFPGKYLFQNGKFIKKYHPSNLLFGLDNLVTIRFSRGSGVNSSARGLRHQISVGFPIQNTFESQRNIFCLRFSLKKCGPSSRIISKNKHLSLRNSPLSIICKVRTLNLCYMKCKEYIEYFACRE